MSQGNVMAAGVKTAITSRRKITSKREQHLSNHPLNSVLDLTKTQLRFGPKENHPSVFPARVSYLWNEPFSWY